jgi:hypothetical protein
VGVNSGTHQSSESGLQVNDFSDPRREGSLYIPAMNLLLSAGLLAALVQQPAPPSKPPQVVPPPPPPAVKVGEPMPDFTLPYLDTGPEGRAVPKQVKLSDYKGKQAVVLAFFPAAFSPG